MALYLWPQHTSKCHTVTRQASHMSRKFNFKYTEWGMPNPGRNLNLNQLVSHAGRWSLCRYSASLPGELFSCNTVLLKV